MMVATAGALALLKPTGKLTADFRLFPFDSGSYSGRIEITPRTSFFSLPVGSALSFQYERYDATTGFQAAIFSGGFRIPMR